MSKKLVSLVLVLALAGMASALQWVGPGVGTQCNFEAASYWATGRLPVASDATTQFYRSDAGGGNIKINTAVSGGIKPQLKYGTAILTIAGSMTSDGSFETTGGTASTVTVFSGASLNVCQKTTVTAGTYKIASTGSSIDTLNVYGTVNVKNVGTMTTANSDILVAGATTSGNAYVNIYNGGLVDTDAITINARGLVTIWGGGVLKLKGDVKAAIDALIGTRIVAGGGTYVKSYVQDGSTFVVPEPATVALLGLGSLMLLRRKR